MTSTDPLKQEIEVLRDRISKLSAASLRISASLDLDMILSEVVDSACALTGARYSVIATIGVSGKLEDFVSSGFTPEEHRQVLEWDDGRRLVRPEDFPGRAVSKQKPAWRSSARHRMPPGHHSQSERDSIAAGHAPRRGEAPGTMISRLRPPDGAAQGG